MYIHNHIYSFIQILTFCRHCKSYFQHPPRVASQQLPQDPKATTFFTVDLDISWMSRPRPVHNLGTKATIDTVWYRLVQTWSDLHNAYTHAHTHTDTTEPHTRYLLRKSSVSEFQNIFLRLHQTSQKKTQNISNILKHLSWCCQGTASTMASVHLRPRRSMEFWDAQLARWTFQDSQVSAKWRMPR